MSFETPDIEPELPSPTEVLVVEEEIAESSREGANLIPTTNTVEVPVVSVTREALGEGWQERSFGVLSEEETMLLRESLDDTTTRTLREGLESEVQKAYDILSRIFKERGQNTEVGLVNNGGKIDCVVKSHIDGDIFYTFLKTTGSGFGAGNSDDGLALAVLSPYKTGVLNSETGEVFSLDHLLGTVKNQTIAFLEVEGKKHDNNFVQPEIDNNDNTSYTTMTSLPSDASDFGTVLHEVGHVLRDNFGVSEKGSSHLRHSTSLSRAAKDSSGYRDSTELLQAQLHLVEEERGANAVALSILKEMSKRGFKIASSSNLDLIRGKSERALKTYDFMPFNPGDKLSQRSIPPRFSGEMRAESRKLQSLLRKMKLGTEALNNFDPETGEMITNNPARQREILEKQTETSM